MLSPEERDESRMIITCPSCAARYKFDESKLGDRPKAKTKCAKCGATIEIENPLLAAMTLPPSFVPAVSPAEGSAPRTLDEQPTRETKVGSASARPAGDEDRMGSSTITGASLHQAGAISLPKDKRFSLAIIQGSGTGQIHQITKSRTVIGRSGADFNIDDAEASRQHASVDIVGETAILRDLGSTNGTFVELDRIEQEALSNQMEFRIGSHVLMFIVTEIE
jgi:predicted Zn finger-like uncharacterized protein